MKKIILCFLILLITACSSNIKKDWDCALKSGGACRTIKEIDSGYNNVKQQKLDVKDLKEYKTIKKQNPISFEELRSQEKISRVVFAPYIDKAGNKHDISQVYYIEFNSEWKE